MGSPSRSECILLLKNSQDNEKVLEYVVSNPSVRVPVYLIPRSSRVLQLAQQFANQRILKMFGKRAGRYILPTEDGAGRVKLQGSGKIEPDALLSVLGIPLSPNGEHTVLLVKLLHSTDLRIVKYLAKNTVINIKEGLYFEEPEERALYYSLLMLWNNKELEYGMKMISDVEGLLKEGKSLAGRVMKYILIKIGNETIRRYLRVSVATLPSSIRILCFMECKLSDNLADLCFDGSLNYSYELFKNKHPLTVSEDVTFDPGVFMRLCEHNVFKKYIYNCWHQGFVKSMASFCNRGDYAYYFKNVGISSDITAHPPKDFEEYEFFSSESQHLDIKSITRYHKRHGTTPALKMYLKKNLERVLSQALDEKTLYSAIKESIKDCSIADQHRVWNKLKKKGRVLKKLYSVFPEHIEPVLYSILSGEHKGITPKEVVGYINTDWDAELVEYFRTVPIPTILSLIDSWSEMFFLTVLLEKTKDEVENVLNILPLLEKSRKKDDLNARERCYEIYSSLFNISDPQIKMELYEYLPDEFKSIYATQHTEFKKIRIVELRGRIEKVLAKDEIDREYYYSTVLYDLRFLFELVGKYDFILLQNFFIGIGIFEKNMINNDNLFSSISPVDSLFSIHFACIDLFKYYVVEYFEELCEAVSESISKENAIKIANLLDEDKIDDSSNITLKRVRNAIYLKELPTDLHHKIHIVFKASLRNRQILFILFPKIISIFKETEKYTTKFNNLPLRILILASIDPSLLITEHTLEFITLTTSLLNEPNAYLSNLARNSLCNITVMNQEIRKILPDFVHACVDKAFVPPFFKSLISITFNNYLCLNSLSFLLQVLFNNILNESENVLMVLFKLPNIVTDKDMNRVGNFIFSKLCSFVSSNPYQSSNVENTARLYARFSLFEDYLLLINSSVTLQISKFLASMLQSHDDRELKMDVISYAITKSCEKPLLIAALCEVAEFEEMLDRSIPTLKRLFLSEITTERIAAERAFKSILSRDAGSLRDKITVFLLQAALFEAHPVKLSAISLITYLPVIYILRSNGHLLVKKAATERWKELVDHTVSAIQRNIGGILDFTAFIANSEHKATMELVIRDLVTKYSTFVDSYLTAHTEYNAMVQGIVESPLPSSRADCYLAISEAKEFILSFYVRTGY